MRAKDLKPIYKAKGFKNLDELAAAARVGREHLTNALNGKRRMSGELTERLSDILDLPPERINPSYKRLVELDPEEWAIIQAFRNIDDSHLNERDAYIRTMLKLLNELSRPNAA